MENFRKLNGFNNGRDTTEGVRGKSSWYFDENNELVVIHKLSDLIDASKKIDIPNPAENTCIIYVDNEGKEISRDYLGGKGIISKLK